MIKRIFLISASSEQAKTAIGKRVTVCDYPDGRLSIRYKASSWLTAPSIVVREDPRSRRQG